MSETNPRFPHWCKIIRKITNDPLVDEEVGLETQGYDPMSDEGEDFNNANGQQYSEETSAEETETKKDSDEGMQTIVIYEGKCRSYKINTTSDKGDVITSGRGLALPLNQDGWDALGVVPLEGDEIVVRHGSTHEEYGNVIDKIVATASFAGTHLVWRYGRN